MAARRLASMLLGVAFSLVICARGWSAAPPVSGRLDIHGDPLPPGAVARLGSVRWQFYRGFHNPILSPDGRWLVSSSELDHTSSSGYIHLWDASTGRLVRSLNGESCKGPVPVPPYAFLPTSKRLLTSVPGSKDLLLWDVPSFRLLKRLPSRALHSLVVSPDERFAAGSRGNGKPWEVLLIDLRTGRAQSVYSADAGHIKFLAFTEDGRLVVVEAVEHGSMPSRNTGFIVVRIDPLTRRAGPELRLSAQDLALSPDGRHLSLSDRRGGLRLYRLDAERGRRLGVSTGPLTDYLKAFSADGRALALVPREIPDYRADGTGILVDRDAPHAGIWDVDRGELLHRVPLADSAFRAGTSRCLLSPDGRTLFLGNAHALVPVSLRTGKPLDDRPRRRLPIDQLRWSADGREVITDTYYIRSRWCASGRLLEQVQLPDSNALAHPVKARSVDGLWLAVAEEQSITILDAVTRKARHRLRGHGHEVTTLGFSADGRVLASTDEGGFVRLWDVRHGRMLRTLDARKTSRQFQRVILSPDGRLLALAEENGRVYLWNAQTGKHLRVLRLAGLLSEDDLQVSMPVTGAFAPCGNRLFLDSWMTLHAWSLARPGEEEPFEQVEMNLLDGGFSSYALSVSPDGRFLARLGSELLLYEVASGRIIYRLHGHHSAIAFHPSLPRLAVAGTKHLDVLVYDLPLLFGSPSPGTRRPTLQELWADLGQPDAVRAQRALWAVAAAPGMEELLAANLKPTVLLDGGRLARRIEGLRSDDFATRQKAKQQLTEAGDAARAAIFDAFSRTKDLELRLKRLLARLNLRTPGQLRQHRALLALETRNSHEARQLLERLAWGMPGATLTEEAKAALERLNRRNGSAP
jgi:WD40 repeat protein